ncbi:MAG TPA: class I SAM-dependent methyltransferase [Gemmatimonadales bacterium]|jgi:SAM-dependent methyltransferase|nr:class I SAM-dependent methyltransferase [Gemmatimonadales bacterium]
MASSSYDAIPDFGLLYDSVPLYAARKDIGFYVEEAARGPGPVLEVGCGTGRILLPIARAGRSIVGLDSSASMLARCRERVAAEPALAGRVALHHQDMRAFDLRAAFPLVIAPFRVVQHVTTVEEQLAFLAAVRGARQTGALDGPGERRRADLLSGSASGSPRGALRAGVRDALVPAGRAYPLAHARRIPH